MTNFHVGCVIVTWNSQEDTLCAVRSLHSQDPLLPLVVVDNASEDNTLALLRRSFPATNIVRLQRNVGFAEGCNIGIKQLKMVDWILLLNSDAILEAGSLERLKAASLAADSDVGMIQPCITFYHNHELVNSTGLMLLRSGRARDRSFGTHVSLSQRAVEVFCSTAGGALYRRSMLDTLSLSSGLFDQEFFMYFEDVDLGWRCRLGGWRAHYCPEAIVRHKFQVSAMKRGSDFVHHQCRANRLISLLKNASIPMLIRTLPYSFLDLAHIIVASGLGGFMAILRRAPTALRDRLRIHKMSRTARRHLESIWLGRESI